MGNAMFSKTIENVRKHKNIELVTNGLRINLLLLDPNRKWSTTFLDENFLPVAMTTAKIEIKKMVYKHNNGHKGLLLRFDQIKKLLMIVKYST